MVAALAVQTGLVLRSAIQASRERGTEADVSQAYNFAVFLSTKHAGARTSLIVDPSNGRIPPLTPEASEGRRRGSGISTRPFASDRNVQGQGGRM
jgi:hypothetical protein